MSSLTQKFDRKAGAPVQSEEIPAQFIEPSPRSIQPITPPLPHVRRKPMNEQKLHPKNPLRPLETKALQATRPT